MVAAKSPSRSVDSEREGGERAGERDVTERVAAEDLAAQHDEVADQPARGGDRGAGEERVADERDARTCRASPVPAASARIVMSWHGRRRHRVSAASQSPACARR